MEILNKQAATAQYKTLKKAIKTAAEQPGSGVVQKGDRFEVTRNFQVPHDGGSIMVRAQSAVDDDITTTDNINAVTTKDGVRSNLKFENFSEKKGWLFKRDQEMLQVTQSETSLGGFSNITSTFEL